MCWRICTIGSASSSLILGMTSGASDFARALAAYAFTGPLFQWIFDSLNHLGCNKRRQPKRFCSYDKVFPTPVMFWNFFAIFVYYRNDIFGFVMIRLPNASAARWSLILASAIAAFTRSGSFASASQRASSSRLWSSRISISAGTAFVLFNSPSPVTAFVKIAPLSVSVSKMSSSTVSAFSPPINPSAVTQAAFTVLSSRGA